MTSGDRVKIVRKKARFNQTEFGDLFGFKQIKIRDIECGKQKVTFEFARDLEARFGASFIWILTGEGGGKATLANEPSTEKMAAREAMSEELAEILGCIDDHSMKAVLAYAKERKLLMLLRERP